MSDTPQMVEPPGEGYAKQAWASLTQEQRDALAMLAGDESRRRLAAWEAFRQQVREWLDNECDVSLQRRVMIYLTHQSHRV